tara:strand:+ start:1018 stop:1956 length:939 start_codon:yes stop_codon:yes gene_type:complete
MKKKSSKFLPISCLGSIYSKTILKELIFSLDSIITQEYRPNEIILIVDGFINNDIYSFLKFVESDNKSIKVFYLKENIGLGLALNYGLKKCKNNIVARFDTDDINLKNRFKIQYDLIKNDENISILGSSVLEFQNNISNIILKTVPTDYKNIVKTSRFRNPLNHPTVIFKKDDILKVGSYRNIRFFEDYDLWLRSIKNNLIIKNINMPLVAMKRETYLFRRTGLRYVFHELNFIKECFNLKTIKKLFLLFFILRIFIRLLPVKISSLVRFFDLSRINRDMKNEITNEISRFKNLEYSYLNRYKKFMLENYKN